MSVSFNEALQKVIQTFLLDEINTAMPGMVERQDGAYRVIVTPTINRKYTNGTVLKYKPIASVPLIVPRTKEAVFRLPALVRGDTVLLVFSQSALDTWLVSEDGKQISPDDPRRFDITDAVAIPGLYPFKVTTPEPIATDSLEIVYKDASIEITKLGQVRINGDNLTVDKDDP